MTCSNNEGHHKRKNIEIIQARILQCSNKEHSLQKGLFIDVVRSSISTYYYLSPEECVATYASHSCSRHSFQYKKLRR